MTSAFSSTAIATHWDFRASPPIVILKHPHQTFNNILAYSALFSSESPVSNLLFFWFDSTLQKTLKDLCHFHMGYRRRSREFINCCRMIWLSQHDPGSFGEILHVDGGYHAIGAETEGQSGPEEAD